VISTSDRKGPGQDGAEVRDLLAPVYNWFSESFDLKDAKALLEELATRPTSFPIAPRSMMSVGFPARGGTVSR